VETFIQARRHGNIDIIIIGHGIEKGSDHIQKIDVLALFNYQGDEIRNGGEFADRGIRFSEVQLFIAFNYYVRLVLDIGPGNSPVVGFGQQKCLSSDPDRSKNPTR
jgi:hypothetical protein